MTVRVFDCPRLGEVRYKNNEPLSRIAGVLCDCFETPLSVEVNLRDEEGEL